ncbi:MAG TPA: hypothetical protein VJ967_11855 [Clostridia bacterium]|nr:hypothetical protein [Clostridia bacterium]
MLIRNFMKPVGILFLLIVLAVSLAAEEEESRDLSIEILLDEFHEIEDAEPAIELDSNENGKIDYLIKTGEDGKKIMEVLDFDHDGSMDDFYMYDHGVLNQRAIDSNADGKIDIWVYLEEGVYIARYEEDTNFDGTMDRVKNYDTEENGEKK